VIKCIGNISRENQPLASEMLLHKKEHLICTFIIDALSGVSMAISSGLYWRICSSL